MGHSQRRLQFDERLKERHGQTPQTEQLRAVERDLGGGAVEYQVSAAGMRNLFKALEREADRNKNKAS